MAVAWPDVDDDDAGNDQNAQNTMTFRDHYFVNRAKKSDICPNITYAKTTRDIFTNPLFNPKSQLFVTGWTNLCN